MCAVVVLHDLCSTHLQIGLDVQLPGLHVGGDGFQEPLASQVLKILPSNIYSESHEKVAFVPTW